MTADPDPHPQPAKTEPPAKAPPARWRAWRRPVASEEVIQDRRIRKWAELLETVVLTIATLATVWAGYQAGKWSGEQIALNDRATAARIQSTKVNSRAQQLQLVDVELFTNWVEAYITNNTPLADFYRDRFRDEFEPAFTAWLATDPFENPEAPRSPFDMPEYRVSELDVADALVEAAGGLAQDSERAGTIGDQFTLSIVILAGSLLLAGIANRFEWAELRAVVVIAALLVLIFSVVSIIRLPTA